MKTQNNAIKHLHVKIITCFVGFALFEFLTVVGVLRYGFFNHQPDLDPLIGQLIHLSNLLGTGFWLLAAHLSSKQSFRKSLEDLLGIHPKLPAELPLPDLVVIAVVEEV